MEAVALVESEQVLDAPVGMVCGRPQQMEQKQVEEPPSGSFSSFFLSLLAQLRFSQVLYRLLSTKSKVRKIIYAMQ